MTDWVRQLYIDRLHLDQIHWSLQKTISLWEWIILKQLLMQNAMKLLPLKDIINSYCNAILRTALALQMIDIWDFLELSGAVTWRHLSLVILVSYLQLRYLEERSADRICMNCKRI